MHFMDRNRSVAEETGSGRARAGNQNSTISTFPDRLLTLQKAVGNRAVNALVMGDPPSLQRVDQGNPYLGALESYLNPLNQIARLAGDDLNPTQLGLLNGIFGAALSTSVIRMNYNSTIASAGGCYRTTGNIINSPFPTIDDDSLVHEAAHVWQHQNGVPFDYAISALSAQAQAEIFTGDWRHAYDYTNVERYHVPWQYWNAEMQAHWIEDHRALPVGWAWDPTWFDPWAITHGDVPFL